MRPLIYLLLALSLGGLTSSRADENVQAVQRRLKQAGFYLGALSGVYDAETSAAVTRYQIRHGLAISGKLDVATAKALGVTARGNETELAVSSGSWRRLRNGDMQFLEKLNAGKIPPPRSPPPSSGKPPPRSTLPPATPPPGIASHPPPPHPGYDRERLRDYVGAFVLAGLDPKVGAELEFFAERVDYFEEPNVGRRKIQRDLLRYDQKWPQRRFWLAGDLKVKVLSEREVRVTFPLGYELRSRSKRASGKVVKMLTLRKTGEGELEIVAVNEKKS